jgi:hypothetical protein
LRRPCFPVSAQEIVERVELLLPEPLLFVDPVTGTAQRVGQQPAVTHSPRFPPADQPSVFEHAQMLRNRRRGHRVWLAEFGNRARTPRQPGQHSAPDRVGKRAEDGAK